MRKTILVAVAALIAAPTIALAGESTVRFTNYFKNVTETALPNGNTVSLIHYNQTATSDKADDPMNNTMADCVGKLIVSNGGEVLSGSGICFAQDVSGAGISFSWKVDEAGTDKCPDLCGSFKTVDTSGKFEGVTASGTWERTHLFADGAYGTIKSTYTKM